MGIGTIALVVAACAAVASGLPAFCSPNQAAIPAVTSSGVTLIQAQVFINNGDRLQRDLVSARAAGADRWTSSPLAVSTASSSLGF